MLKTTLAVLLSAALMWFGNGLEPLWPLMWFAPLPILLLALRSSWWTTALAAASALLLGSLSMWQYLVGALKAPPIAWMTTYSLVAVVFTASVLLFRALAMRGASWSALFAFPAAWVSCEYLSTFLTPHGTAGSLAYTQLKFLPFLQLASLTGPWGMSFLLMLFPAGLAVGHHLRDTSPRLARMTVAVPLACISLVLVFGFLRLSSTPRVPTLKVGLAASDGPAQQFADYAAAAEGLARQGAQVVILPEKISTLKDPDAGGTDALFQSVADRTGASVVMGLVHVASPLRFNQARLYAPRVAPMRYDKHHMLPPFESMYKPGSSTTLVPRSDGSLGVTICKDMDFTGLSRQYGAAGAALLLVPAWDFNIDRAWHGHMAVMRGVESGFSIARAAKNGFLTVSDDRGRIVAEVRSDSAPFATLLTDVPTVHDRTLYLLWGDWFAFLAIGLLVVTTAQLFRERSAGR